MYRLHTVGMLDNMETQQSIPNWTFLSNHAHVLLLIARDPDVKLRDIALKVGITERAVQRIVADLEAADYLERSRSGRRNRYRVHADLPLRHPIEAQTEIGQLLHLILKNNRIVDHGATEPANTKKRRGGKSLRTVRGGA